MLERNCGFSKDRMLGVLPDEAGGDVLAGISPGLALSERGAQGVGLAGLSSSAGPR